MRVVALDIQSDHAVRDEAVMRHREWSLRRVPLHWGSPLAFIRRGWAAAGQGAALAAWSAGMRSPSVADRALSRYLWPLTRAGDGEEATVVMAHGLEALPIAARLADHLSARLGFDSEDLHAGELPDDPRYDARRALVAAVERRYLSRCAYVTAASTGIADALAQSYSIRRPLVVPNTFPRGERPAGGRDRLAPRPGPPSLYWYSQVIGEGRGLDDAVDALALIGGAVQLHLRGHADPIYAASLMARARARGVADRVFISPLAEPGQLVSLAAEHDIGLALEQRAPRNRDVCVTNKFYVYLLAGLAVAASETSGQREAMAKAPEAGFLYPPGDAQALAEGIRTLLESPASLARAQAAAWRAADEGLSWEFDAPRLVAYLTGDADPMAAGDQSGS